jgi:integrase
MPRPRSKPDGLPARVYERYGLKRYSIGHKGTGGGWTFRLDCPVSDLAGIKALRAEATMRAGMTAMPRPAHGTVESLIKAYFDWQDKLPEASAERKADSTLTENRREASNLSKSFGAMQISDLRKSDAYAYLHACAQANRPEKGNKEIALMRTILEHGVRIGVVEVNPFDGVRKNKTVHTARLVTDAELALAVATGRRLGGARHIVALALQCAWLCVRRSVEVRALTRDQLKPDGIEWIGAKRQRTQTEQHGLIEWSPALRACIDEALAIKRNALAGTWYVFGNLRGQRYTKGGWKAMLDDLMRACEEQAAKEGVEFARFSLQDCRPKGATDKRTAGHTDVQDAMLHTSARMVDQVYDRRRLRVAKPVK